MPNAKKTNPEKTATIALLGRPLQSRAPVTDTVSAKNGTRVKFAIALALCVG